VKTVFTIHNLGYQGLFPATSFSALGLPPRAFTMDGLEYWGGVNLLKGGVVFSDAITTVSPTYAREIRTPEFGSGLEGVLQAQSDKLVGILNGVDYGAWDPRTDTYLKERYTGEDLRGKAVCKRDLVETLGLSPGLMERPVIGMISRLAGQKGVDLVAGVVDRLMLSGAGLVVLGRGETRYEDLLRHTASQYPDQMAVRIDFDESLAHKIEAGCDMYLMPSRYEPCGLNQMYSLRYGTVPIVRRTGGLADTVAEVNTKRGTGTGFTFAAYTPEALWGAIDRAMKCFAQTDVWNEVVIRAMSADFSWSRSAREYVKLYRRLLRRE